MRYGTSKINDLIVRERNVSRLHTSLAPTELIDIGFVRGGEVEAEAPPLNTHFELHFKRRIPAGDECITTDTFCYSPLIDCLGCSKIYIMIGPYTYWKRPPDVILYVREGLEQESNSVKVGGVHEYEWQFNIVWDI